MNDPSVDLRLAALRARRPESAVARLAGDLDPPRGTAIELPPPLLMSQTDHLVDPVVLAGTHRVGRGRSYPAGRARIGVSVAAAVSFMALVPVMGPLTAADNDGEPQLPDDEPAQRETTSIPDGSVESTIDLTTTTMTVAPTEAVVVDPATATTTVPTAPVVPGAPIVAAAPLGSALPPRGGAAPTPATPAAPTPAAPTPAAPTPAAPTPPPAPAAPSAPDVTAPPVVAPAPTTPAPVATSAPTPQPAVPPTTPPPPPPPPPPPTTAPPPPTTAPPPPTTSPS